MSLVNVSMMTDTSHEVGCSLDDEASLSIASNLLLQFGRGGENTLVQLRLYMQAAKAAGYGARPPVMSALTGIKDSVARKIYKDATGHAPPKGQLPGDEGFYTSGLQRHIDSIWLLLTYKGLSFNDDSKLDHIDCSLLTYSLYLKEFPEPTISYDRFFLLIRLAVYGKYITTEICEHCDGPMLVHPYHAYSGVRLCPVCELNIKRMHTALHSKKQIT